MEVTEINGSRFDLALELFKEGNSFNFRGIIFRLVSDGFLEISVQSSWLIGNTTKETALEDFKIAKNLTNTLVEESLSFASLVKNRPRRFILVDDDGKCAVELCRLMENKIIWAKGCLYISRKNALYCDK